MLQGVSSDDRVVDDHHILSSKIIGQWIEFQFDGLGPHVLIRLLNSCWVKKDKTEA